MINIRLFNIPNLAEPGPKRDDMFWLGQVVKRKPTVFKLSLKVLIKLFVFGSIEFLVLNIFYAVCY